MIPTVEKVNELAFSLPVSEREKLGSALLQSTHNGELTDNDREWIAVAEERYHNLLSGKDQGIPDVDFFTRVQAELRWK